MTVHRLIGLAALFALLGACASSGGSSEDAELREQAERRGARSIAQAPSFVKSFDPAQERPLSDEPASAFGFTGENGEEAAEPCQVKFFNETRWKVRIYLEQRYLGTVFPLESSQVALRTGSRKVLAWADPGRDPGKNGTQWKREFSCQPEQTDQWYLYEPTD